jgi:hypothetical protein
MHALSKSACPFFEMMGVLNGFGIFGGGSGCGGAVGFGGVGQTCVRPTGLEDCTAQSKMHPVVLVHVHDILRLECDAYDVYNCNFCGERILEATKADISILGVGPKWAWNTQSSSYM